MTNMVIGISDEQMRNVLKIDAKRIASSSKMKEYISANADQYRLLVDTWLLLCEDIAGVRATRVLSNSILQNGLISTIDSCANLANIAIRALDTEDFEWPEDNMFVSLLQEDIAATLQLLRYPKRFSPFKADIVRDNSIRSFLRINSLCKPPATAIDRDTGAVIERDFTYPRWLIQRLKEKLAELLPLDPPEDIWSLGEFSSGVCAEGFKSLGAKLQVYGDVEPNYGGWEYPLRTTDPRGIAQQSLVVKAVPKSYKAARIIAEAPAYAQFCMQGIRKAMIAATASSHYASLVILDDQSINQEWARLGSVYGCYATIDLSSASDSISDSLARQILPSKWYDLINQVNPTHMLVNGKAVPRWIFQTSGNGTTFCAESDIFLAVALVATDLYREFSGEWVALPRVYGDDIIIDDRVVETLADLFSMLHFYMNADKSFGSESTYRESCGAEYWRGLNTASSYWPRKTVNPHTNEGKESLISLQHKLYGYVGVEMYLHNKITSLFWEDLHMHITSSPVGSECADLWDDVPIGPVRLAPYDKNRTPGAVPIPKRQGHLALVVKPGKRECVPLAHQPMEMDLEIFHYVEFLKNGPQYEDPLSRLLNVSMPRRAVTLETCKPSTEWRVVY